ncbi:hypothetical protein E9993_22890 [Labilibacter sediminis]|nr:hypothetical protein E9993_22890 [Labilibacter sediminis]
MKTNDELKAEVAEKERQIRSTPYMVKKVFLCGEIQARLATMQHVVDMLMMVDRSITMQKNQIAVLEGK